MSSRAMLVFAAVSGFVYVMLGAFGAHVLSKSLGSAEMAWIKTGLDYQAFHTLAIMGLAAAMIRRANFWFYWSSALLALGTVLFSGSLYCLALSHLKLWVFVTPIGGTCFLIGWILMLVGALRLKKGQNAMNKVLLYCRQGFEKECAAEITAKAAQREVFGFARVKDDSGYVLFECYQAEEAEKLIAELPFSELIFARQMIVVGELLRDLPPEDRVTPVTGMLTGFVEKGGELRVEVPDTNESKELLKFCRKFTVPLRSSLRAAGILLKYETDRRPVVHVFFIAPGCCYVGYSMPKNNSPLFMGIQRLKFPSDAPSRSTLKLEEAFHAFIPADEWDERLGSGLFAVDLGACPGGWTYQLVKRSMMVHAVDNGPMAPSLMDTGQVFHHREDGFKYRPTRSNIYWVVCDMVEKPVRVANLMADWVVNGWCREAIFNLKLPMKKRYEEVSQNLAMIDEKLKANGINAQIQARQLYHDREEVTVHIRRIWAAEPGRRDEK